MTIISIAAHDLNRVIGAENKLLWRVPKDMQFFKQQTIGNTVIMGSSTWESIPDAYKPLPDRLNVVLTRNPSMELPEDVFLASSLQSAFDLISQIEEYKDKKVFLGGGQMVYEEGMFVSDELLITVVHTEADTNGLNDVKYFPEINADEWELVSDSGKVLDEKSGLEISFLHYKRK